MAIILYMHPNPNQTIINNNSREGEGDGNEMTTTRKDLTTIYSIE